MDMWNNTVSYIVKLPNGMTWRRYQDQLKSCSEQITQPNQPPIHDSISEALLTAPSTRQQSSLQTVPTRVHHEHIILQASILLTPMHN